MTYRVAVVLATSALVSLASAQKLSDCPPHTVINNGVCIGKDGNDCSKQAQSSICYAADPQYTDEAARANIKGTVRLTTTVRIDGCGNDIKIVGSLGYGLDEAAVSALNDTDSANLPSRFQSTWSSTSTRSSRPESR